MIYMIYSLWNNMKLTWSIIFSIWLNNSTINVLKSNLRLPRINWCQWDIFSPDKANKGWFHNTLYEAPQNQYLSFYYQIFTFEIIMYPRALIRGNPPSTTLTWLLRIEFPLHPWSQLIFLIFSDRCENSTALVVYCIGTISPLRICYQEVFL